MLTTDLADERMHMAESEQQGLWLAPMIVASAIFWGTILALVL